MKDTKRLTLLSLLVSVAMVLSYLESLVPVFVSVPGVKMGFSNVATIFALYSLGPLAAVGVSIVRVVLSSLLFGNLEMMIYSLFGAALSLIFMIILKKSEMFSTMGVSAVGGVMHNAGQSVAASILLRNSGVLYYFVPLVISGTLAGVVIGIISGIMIKRLGNKINKN